MSSSNNDKKLTTYEQINVYIDAAQTEFFLFSIDLSMRTVKAHRFYGNVGADFGLITVIDLGEYWGTTTFNKIDGKHTKAYYPHPVDLLKTLGYTVDIPYFNKKPEKPQNKKCGCCGKVGNSDDITFSPYKKRDCCSMCF